MTPTPTLDLTQPQHVITPQGVVRLQITQTNLGPLDSLAQRLQSELPIRFPAITDPDSADIVRKGDFFYIARVLPVIALGDINVVTDAEGLLVPDFVKAARDGVPMPGMTWTPSAGTLVRFGLEAKREGTVWRYNTAYLVASIAGQAGNFLPPLPNIHTESKICMRAGGGYAATAPSLLGLLDKVIGDWQNSGWNTDLTYDGTAVRKLIRWNPRDVRTSLDPATPIHELMRRVAHPSLEYFVPAIPAR